MGWISSDELHEGYLAAVLVDGKTSSTDDQGNHTGKNEQRTDDEIVAWVLGCDCTSSSTGDRVTWLGDRWERVATPALEDPENGLIYVAPGDSATYVMVRHDVEAVVRSRWLAEHVSLHEALDVIRTARADIAAAKRRLDAAVLYARAAGQTWTTIGEAAGISRQSAQERWGSRASRGGVRPSGGWWPSPPSGGRRST